jgi:hypothetical protein
MSEPADKYKYQRLRTGYLNQKRHQAYQENNYKMLAEQIYEPAGLGSCSSPQIEPFGALSLAVFSNYKSSLPLCTSSQIHGGRGRIHEDRDLNGSRSIVLFVEYQDQIKFLT